MITSIKNNHIIRYTYIYKDFREYKIDGLALDNNSKFKIDSKDSDLIRTIDKCDRSEYVIDLSRCTFIELPLEENK